MRLFLPTFAPLALVLWTSPVFADATPDAQAGKDAECTVKVASFGSYYDPKGALGYALLPAQGVGLLAKLGIAGLKAATKAGNNLEGRGVMTAHFSMSLEVTKGTLPGPTPAPRNFMTADNLGEAGNSAYKVAEDYGKKAGCAKVKVQQIPSSADIAKVLQRIQKFLAQLFTYSAYAEPPPEAMSLKDARDGFGMSSAQLAAALGSLAGSGCIKSGSAIGRVQDVQGQVDMITKNVGKHLDHLNALVGVPMVSTGSAACEGSFTSLIREIDVRKDQVESSRQSLTKAAQRQMDIVGALADVNEYDVSSMSCGKQAFNGFKKSVNDGLAALGALSEIDTALRSTVSQLTALNEQHKRLLASCGQNGAAQQKAVSGAKPSGEGGVKYVPVPAGASENVPSDITGLIEDLDKRNKAP